MPDPAPNAEQCRTCRRVLVVEDDPVTRTALVRLLADAGHDVRSAENALRGLLALRGFRPDRLVLDLVLPGGQPGEHLLHAVRALCPATRVAVVTGVEDADRLGRLADLGAERVLRKPVCLPDLLAWVEAGG